MRTTRSRRPLSRRAARRRSGHHEPERVVEPIDVGSKSLGDHEERSVRCQPADLRVERGQPLDIDEQEEERAMRSAGPGDLTLEDRLEGAPVVEACEEVELGYHVGLPEVQGSGDRRARSGHDLGERGDIVLAEPALRLAGQDAEKTVWPSSPRRGRTRPARIAGLPSGASMSPENATSIARAPR